VLLTLALLSTTATNTAFFPATGGILAAGLATLLGRIITRRTWVAGLLALAGASVLLLEGSAAGHGGGDLLALGAALAYMFYLFQADQLSHGAGPALWAVLGIELLATTAVLGLLAAWFGNWTG
jgi:drug/metabolite transporter (DMT)-like permease